MQALHSSVLIADPSEIGRWGWWSILNSLFETWTSASDGREAVVKAVTDKPELMIVDSTIPVLKASETARYVKRLAPLTRVLIAAQDEDDPLLSRPLPACVDGCVRKDQRPKAILFTIRAALNPSPPASAASGRNRSPRAAKRPARGARFQLSSDELVRKIDRLEALCWRSHRLQTARVLNSLRSAHIVDPELESRQASYVRQLAEACGRVQRKMVADCLPALHAPSEEGEFVPRLVVPSGRRQRQTR
ncbi:MAG TPA: hypothetical protein VK009_09375 [Chloroflexota bacterium]|nr:hypothetical protein [Chloroflexota bacterium]